uniref:Uncharacterized protein n=1 Tax=Clastoptera arizonana TaxID=38151 RepID=A0A1B6DPD7_9HEMI
MYLQKWFELVSVYVYTLLHVTPSGADLLENILKGIEGFKDIMPLFIINSTNDLPPESPDRLGTFVGGLYKDEAIPHYKRLIDHYLKEIDRRCRKTEEVYRRHTSTMYDKYEATIKEMKVEMKLFQYAKRYMEETHINIHDPRYVKTDRMVRLLRKTVYPKDDPMEMMQKRMGNVMQWFYKVRFWLEQDYDDESNEYL